MTTSRSALRRKAFRFRPATRCWCAPAGSTSSTGSPPRAVLRRSRSPASSLSCVDFIRDNDLAAVGSDNAAIECIPFDDDRFLAVHIELLVKLGIPLIEHLVLSPMAADKCYSSLLVVAPMLVTGGTGSPVNPIAIG